MLKRMFLSLFAVMAMWLWSGAALAASVGAAEAVAGGASGVVSRGSLEAALLHRMEVGGDLSAGQAKELAEKYVDSSAYANTLQKLEPPSAWSRAVSLANFVYAVGVCLLLVVFGRFLAQIKGLLLKVPMAVYQGVLGAVAVALVSNRWWLPATEKRFDADDRVYMAVFGAVAVLMVMGWVLETYPKIAQAFARLFGGIFNVQILVSCYLLAYFGILAFAYQSQMLGFAAAVAFSGLLSFTVGYRPGVLWADFDAENSLPMMVWGHLLALGSYSVAKALGVFPAEAMVFEAGLTYYCGIALGIAFLVAASPFEWRSGGVNTAGYLLLFVLTLTAGVYGFFVYDLKVVGSILCVFGVLLAAEWYGKLCYSVGFIPGGFLLGVALIAAAKWLPQYAEMLVLKM